MKTICFRGIVLWTLSRTVGDYFRFAQIVLRYPDIIKNNIFLNGTFFYLNFPKKYFIYYLMSIAIKIS